MPRRPRTPLIDELKTSEPAPLKGLYTAQEVGRGLPRPVTGSTIWRWHRYGLLVKGEVVRLNATRLGRRLYFTVDDLMAFARRAGSADTTT